jgi:hypothetical protein
LKEYGLYVKGNSTGFENLSAEKEPAEVLTADAGVKKYRENKFGHPVRLGWGRGGGLRLPGWMVELVVDGCLFCVGAI